jgi:hypothetical protein
MLYNVMPDLPDYTIHDYVRCLKCFEFIRDNIDEARMGGQIIDSTRSEIASRVFKYLPPQSISLFSFKEKEYSEDEYHFKPLLYGFPGYPERNIRSLKEIQTDYQGKRITHFEGIEENFKPVVYDVIVSGLQDSGKTYNLGRLAVYFKNLMKEEQDRITDKNSLSEFISKLESKVTDEDEKRIAKRYLKQFGEEAKFHDPRNPLGVFASSTNIPEESMGDKAVPSTDVEVVTLYYNFGIINFIILPGQTKYKRGTSKKVFQLYSEFEETSENGTKEKVVKTVRNIDPILDGSLHNYIDLQVNISNNRLFEGGNSGEFIDYVFSKIRGVSCKESGYTKLLSKFHDWRSDYEKLKEKASGNPKELESLTKKIDEMRKQIKDVDLAWLANTFTEAATWDVYSRDHPNTKVMGITFTAADLKREISDSIFNKMGEETYEVANAIFSSNEWGWKYFEKGMGWEEYLSIPNVRNYFDEKFFDVFFSEISDFLSPFIHPQFRGKYLELQPGTKYRETEISGPLPFLFLLHSNIKKDIQKSVVDKHLSKLSVDELEVFVERGFEIESKYLKQVFDKQMAENELRLINPYLSQLMKDYAPTELNLDFSVLLKLKSDPSFELPETYAAIVDADLRKQGRRFVNMLDTYAQEGQTFDLVTVKEMYQDVKETYPQDLQSLIESKFESAEQSRIRLEQANQMRTSVAIGAPTHMDPANLRGPPAPAPGIPGGFEPPKPPGFSGPMGNPPGLRGPPNVATVVDPRTNPGGARKAIVGELAALFAKKRIGPRYE